MSNKIIWVLIIIWFIWAWYLFITLNNDIDIKKENLANLEEKQEIKEIKSPELVIQVIEKEKISNIEKIEEIKKKNSSYKIITLDNKNKVYFIKVDNSLDLFLNKTKIWSFSLVDYEYLRSELVKWTESDLYIEIWSDKFYYNDRSKSISEIKININVEYVKNWLDNNLIIVTTKGSFIYSIYDSSLNYFSYFNDFVYLNNWYIWLVQEDEKRILNNLWFEATNNIVVYYNPSTKEKKIIYNTDLNIIKIYVVLNKLYLVTDDNEIFELDNI